MDYEQKLHIDDDTFSNMRANADKVLQRLVKNMVEKGSLEGSMTIKVDVLLEKEFIPNYDPLIDGETRMVLKPKFQHKVSSMMQIKDEEKGKEGSEGMELVWDEDAGEYVLKPITGTEQMNIFDAEFREAYEYEYEDDEEATLIGSKAVALIGTSDEEDESDDTETEEVAEGNEDSEEDEEPEDISDEFCNSQDTFDDYGYQEPDEE